MRIIADLLQAYVVVIFLRIIASYFPAPANPQLSKVIRVLHDLTEPVLGPVRRVIPPVGLGGMQLDLSPIIVLVVLELLIPRL